MLLVTSNISWRWKKLKMEDDIFTTLRKKLSKSNSKKVFQEEEYWNFCKFFWNIFQIFQIFNNFSFNITDKSGIHINFFIEKKGIQHVGKNPNSPTNIQIRWKTLISLPWHSISGPILVKIFVKSIIFFIREAVFC